MSQNVLLPPFLTALSEIFPQINSNKKGVMTFDTEQQELYNECLQILVSKYGARKDYLPALRRYVFTSIKAERIAMELTEEDATVKHTNRAGHTNDASSPKARMFALFNEQSIKLGRELGLNLVQVKAGRPKKTNFDLTKMKIA